MYLGFRVDQSLSKGRWCPPTSASTYQCSILPSCLSEIIGPTTILRPTSHLSNYVFISRRTNPHANSWRNLVGNAKAFCTFVFTLLLFCHAGERRRVHGIMSHAGSEQIHDAEYSNEPGGAASQAVDTIAMAPLDLGDSDMVPPDQAGAVPRAVTRLSCVHCRKKKLKCNRAWPLCARCKTLKQDCTYPASKQHNSGRRRQVQGPTDKSGQYQASGPSRMSG